MKKRIIALLLLLTIVFTGCNNAGKQISKRPVDSNEESRSQVETKSSEYNSKPQYESQTETQTKETQEYTQNIQESQSEPQKEEINEAQQLVDNMKAGWNLGNTFDASDCTWLTDPMEYEAAWCGVKTTTQLIDEVKNAGFNSIRIPVSWHNHISGENNIIDAKWLERVTEIVDYCMEKDMYVIINIHHDNSNQYIMPRYEYLEQSKKYLKDIWSQLAQHFKNYDNHLIFESMNEPRLIGSQYEWWIDINNNECREAIECINILNQEFVNIIRGSGDNNSSRFITVPGYCASYDGVLNDYFKIPKDTVNDRLLITVHAYIPYNFALQGKWEAGNVNTFDSNRKESTEVIDKMMKGLYDKFVSKGQPVIIDEFGARSKDNNLNARVEFAEYYVALARKYSITCFWWDNNAFTNDGESECFGLIDRSKNQWIYPEIVKAIIENSK